MELRQNAFAPAWTNPSEKMDAVVTGQGFGFSELPVGERVFLLGAGFKPLTDPFDGRAVRATYEFILHLQTPSGVFYDVVEGGVYQEDISSIYRQMMERLKFTA